MPKIYSAGIAPAATFGVEMYVPPKQLIQEMEKTESIWHRPNRQEPAKPLLQCNTDQNSGRPVRYALHRYSGGQERRGSTRLMPDRKTPSKRQKELLFGKHMDML